MFWSESLYPVSCLPLAVSCLPLAISCLPSLVSHLLSPISHASSLTSCFPSSVSHGHPSPVSRLLSHASCLRPPVPRLPSPVIYYFQSSPVSHLQPLLWPNTAITNQLLPTTARTNHRSDQPPWQPTTTNHCHDQPPQRVHDQTP